MILKKLSPKDLYAVYHGELTAAFPPEERKPLSTIEGLMEKGRYFTYGAYENGGRLVGYAFLWSSPKGDYLLLDYLGVFGTEQSRGLGGAIMTALKRQFAQVKGIVIEAEALQGDETDAQRRRRLDFYRKNGCRTLPHDAHVFGVHYNLLLLSSAEDMEPVEVLSAYQDLYGSSFTKAQQGKYLRIPFDSSKDSPPVIDWGSLGRSL